MSIIFTHIILFGEKFPDRNFIQQRSILYSQDFVCTSIMLKIMLNNSYHTICDDSCKYLDSNSTFGCASKGFNLKMLLNPFKEEFHMPPVLIEQGNLINRGFNVICQVNICMVQGFGIVNNPAKLSPILLGGSITDKFYYLISQYAIGIMVCILILNYFILQTAFLSNNKIRFYLRNMIKPLQIKISSVKNIICTRFIRYNIHCIHIMNFGRSYMLKGRTLGFNIEQGVEFDSSYSFTELFPPEDTQTQVYCSGIKSIDFPFKFKVLD